MNDAGTTLIISDTHLAHPAVRGKRRLTAAHLRPLWQGVKRLVVAGDLAELQLVAARVEAAREVEALKDMCEQDGVELVILSGNHDAFVSDQRSLSLMNGAVLVTHGDVLHPAIAPWSRGAAAMKRNTLEGVRRYCVEHGVDALGLQGRLEVAQHVAHRQFVEHESGGKHGVMSMLRRPDRVALMAWYWRNQASLGAAFLEAMMPAARVLIFGHSHRPGVWQRGGRWVINTGSFALPCRPRGVRIVGNQLAFHKITRGADGVCALHEKVLFAREFGSRDTVRHAA